MQANITYFVRAHTAKGKTNLLSKNMQGINDYFVLKGTLTEKAYFFNKLSETMKNVKCVEWLKNPEYPSVYEGAILRGYKTAILNEDICVHLVGNKEIIVLSNGKEKKLQAISFENVYDQLSKALQYHFELEKIYVAYMDFAKADKLINHVKKEISKTLSVQENHHVYERFFGTFTLQGSTNTVNELLQPMKNIYHIKGKAGTGKSHFIKQIINLCEYYRLSYEVYYCGFDPSSVDMLIIRPLHTCFFDSTFPHEFVPKEGEFVIDLYKEAVNPEVEKIEANKIKKYTQKYSEHIQNAKQLLKEIKMNSPQEKLTEQDKNHIDERINKFLQLLNA